MLFALQVLALAVDLPLLFLIITSLLRGTWRRFPLVLVLTLVELISALVQMPGAIEHALGRSAPGMRFAQVYWVSQTTFRLLVYAVVIGFLYQACGRLRSVKPSRIGLIVGACLVAGGTLLASYDGSLTPGRWLTPWLRDVTFIGALMDLMLWTLLVASRDKDHQLLLLSGGLGVEFAGDAIGDSLRQLAIQPRSHALWMTGNLVTIAAGAFRYYAWWRALRRQPAEDARASRAALPQAGFL